MKFQKKSPFHLWVCVILCSIAFVNTRQARQKLTVSVRERNEDDSPTSNNGTDLGGWHSGESDAQCPSWASSMDDDS